MKKNCLSKYNKIVIDHAEEPKKHFQRSIVHDCSMLTLGFVLKDLITFRLITVLRNAISRIYIYTYTKYSACSVIAITSRYSSKNINVIVN
jgi:hypothetical protein